MIDLIFSYSLLRFLHSHFDGLSRWMRSGWLWLPIALAASVSCPSVQAQGSDRKGDYILVVVNQELVTAAELDRRVAMARSAGRAAAQVPTALLQQQALDSLIEDRVLVTHARSSGIKVEDAELDRAVSNVAQQNQITMSQLRERLESDGSSYERFRSSLRDQLLVEKVREREVLGRVRVSDVEVENWLAQKRRELSAQTSYEIAQILIKIPENAGDAELAERRSVAQQIARRLDAGEAFEVVAKEVSDDAATRDQGGNLGARTAERLPDLFVNAVRSLRPGQRSPQLVQSAAGFHILKLINRTDHAGFSITQTRARHILLRPSAQLSAQAAAQRLQEFKRQVLSGSQGFAQLARDNSEDGSAAQGGDLGWASPGFFVPEFEQAMNALPLGGISDPVVSRFGVHLIQVLERRERVLDLKQQRELARSALREQKFEAAYAEWLSDLRARAYIEMRDVPQ